MINLLSAIKVLSPLHCGVGIGMNDIDLPVARHKVSGHPIIPGTSMKGVLKDEFQSNIDKQAFRALFGANNDDPDIADNESFASAISIGDATLLALPVRSFYGTFAYLASPYTLQQLKAAAPRIGFIKDFPSIPTQLGLKVKNDSYRVMLTSDSLLKSPDKETVLLEELDLQIDPQKADNWAAVIAEHFFDPGEESDLFKKRFAIVDDNALNFLCETALPVDAHIAINQDTGAVKPGALWYEETVPAESLFFGVIGVDRSFMNGVNKDAAELVKLLIPEDKPNRIFAQMGGKATTGKGLVSVRFARGA